MGTRYSEIHFFANRSARLSWYISTIAPVNAVCTEQPTDSIRKMHHFVPQRPIAAFAKTMSLSTSGPLQHSFPDLRLRVRFLLACKNNKYHEYSFDHSGSFLFFSWYCFLQVSNMKVLLSTRGTRYLHYHFLSRSLSPHYVLSCDGTGSHSSSMQSKPISDAILETDASGSSALSCHWVDSKSEVM